MNKTISSQRIKELNLLLGRLNIDTSNVSFNKTQSTYCKLDEALTHTSAQAEVNHERLEFLGDAVLRLAASEFIDRNFPEMQVGERSALRSELVSDNWLTKVGNSISIEKVLLIGPKAARDPSALATLQAEATEALIGALYESNNDLEAIHSWLTEYWEETSAAVLADPYKKNSKSALQEWSQAKGLDLPIYESQERCKEHGSQKRFFCRVHIDKESVGEGWGRSRKEAEKEAAKQALNTLKG